MKNNYQSEQLEICHKTAKALYKIGAIDSAKMMEFDKACFIDEPDTASQSSNVLKTVTPALAKQC